jgi:fibronectin-binding autotransporter adhesin
MTVASLDGTLFAAPGTNLPRSYLTTGASVMMHLQKHLDVTLTYDAVINTWHASEHKGSLLMGCQF